MRKKRKNLVIVVLHEEGGFEVEARDMIDSRIREVKADFHEFIAPHSFHIVFKNNVKNSYRAGMFIEEMATLAREQPWFAHMRIGRHAGECLCQVDAFGRIRSVPIGIVVWEAMKAAVS